MAALLLLLWAVDAVAAPEGRAAQQANETVAAGDFARPSVELSTSTLPSFDNFDGSTRSSHLDLSVMPHDGSGLGVSLGIGSSPAPGPAFVSNPQASQSLDLGLRWRYTTGGGQRFDVTAYRRMPERDAISLVESRDPSYGARFEMALGSTKLRKGFVAEHGFVGLQLESGARLTIKRSGGVPMLYYRNTF